MEAVKAKLDGQLTSFKFKSDTFVIYSCVKPTSEWRVDVVTDSEVYVSLLDKAKQKLLVEDSKRADELITAWEHGAFRYTENGDTAELLIDPAPSEPFRLTLDRTEDAFQSLRSVLIQQCSKAARSAAETTIRKLEEELAAARRELDRTRRLAPIDDGGFTKRVVPAKRPPPAKSLMNPRMKMREATGTTFGSDSEDD